MGERLVVVDYMYLVHKYMHANVPPQSWGNVDTTLIYYPLREIMKWSNKGETRTVIAFDARSKRKELNADYKKKRASFPQEVLNQVIAARDLLRAANFNVYHIPDMEADDIIYSLVNKYKDRFDRIDIYSKDYDILCNVDKTVYVNLYKQGIKVPIVIGPENYSAFLANAYKIPNFTYGALWLYKACVHDSSDGLSGVPGFGTKGFAKLLEFAAAYKLPIHQHMTKEEMYSIVDRYFETAVKKNAFRESLELVYPFTVDVAFPMNIASSQSRQVFRDFGMISFT